MPATSSILRPREYGYDRPVQRLWRQPDAAKRLIEHGGQRDQLSAGGFNYMPAKMHHQAWASDDALVSITVDAAWDIHWVPGALGKADSGETSVRP